eukprot:116698_1
MSLIAIFSTLDVVGLHAIALDRVGLHAICRCTLIVDASVVIIIGDVIEAFSEQIILFFIFAIWCNFIYLFIFYFHFSFYIIFIFIFIFIILLFISSFFKMCLCSLW